MRSNVGVRVFSFGVWRGVWAGVLAAAALVLFSLPSHVTAGAPVVTSICIQDDFNTSVLTFNPATGAYMFTSTTPSFTASGTGAVKRDGSTITLTDVRADRRLTALVDSAQKKGRASYQRIQPPALFTIVDRNTANDTCGIP
jgi:hypothetical protein